MSPTFRFGLLFFCGLLAAMAAKAYDFPHTDRYVATVVGTPTAYQAELPGKIPFRQRALTVFPDRKVPEVLFWGEELQYSQALQRGRAPLVFLIAGTGASHNGGKNYDMARAFYQAGMHVVSISSPTLPNFTIAASKTGVPGHARRDAEDIYRVMELIWQDLKDDIEVSEFHVTGYSLGAFNSAFVAMLDEERRSFDFSRVLLINPPVSLYNSISLLDRMVENIPGGEDNFAAFFEKLVRAFGEVYSRGADTLGDDFLYSAYEALELKDEELAALIGVSFRISSSSLVFASDVMTDYGFVKPKGLVLPRRASTTPYRQVLNRLGFTDFYHDFFYPFYRDLEPGLERDAMIRSMSLTAIQDYLRDAGKVFVMHNADDVILEPGEIDFFTRTFGSRAKIYPHGGHCGNMSHRDNVAHMVATLAN
jgi:hypothetical protein